MSVQVREEAEEITLGEVREGERVIIEYRSSQSRNIVQQEGVVKEADRLGIQTRSFILHGDNGTDYNVNRHRYVRSTGANERKLSMNHADVYRVEGLDIESWEHEIVEGAVHIYRSKDDVFDCPFCGTEDSASVNSVNETNVTVSCGSCRQVEVMNDQPLTMVLKVVR